ncbi:MAG: glutathione S-transferase [Alteromonadaceae bacterium]|jgi:glutathione S-transferase
MELVIGNKNYSSWSLRPWLLLTYFEVTFSEIHINLFGNDMHEQMKKYCPNKKVPVLIDRQTTEDFTVWDSLAICEYINEQYLNGQAWPDEISNRALARSICSEMHSGFFALRNELPMSCRRKKAAIKLSKSAQQDISRIIEIFSNCLSKNKISPITKSDHFLFGEFSIADAYFMPVVSRFNTYAIEVPKQVEQYIERMLLLPSYQKWQGAAESENEIIAVAEK